MHQYEVIVEEITPCGGEKYARRTILEVEAQSPEDYALADGRYPILEVRKKADGSTVITTGNGKGNLIRFTFTE